MLEARNLTLKRGGRVVVADYVLGAAIEFQFTKMLMAMEFTICTKRLLTG